MLLDIVFLIAGLLLIIYGADVLVEGASTIARKAKISEFVIGLTIVGFGTSCPELVVSLTGAIQGNADISVGNVIGSNIFNVLLSLGLIAVIAPVAITKSNSRRDIPVALLVTFLFAILGTMGGGLSRIEGVVFLILFASYIYMSFKTDSGADAGAEESKIKNVWVAVLACAAGLAGLIFGGQLFVNNATELARAVGVSDKFIAITLLAGGTSLPELATCIVAARKGKDQLALGNILGSNVFNILLILGLSAVVTPLSFASINMVDILAVVLSVVLLWMWTYTGKKNVIDRWEGALMLAGYIIYIVLLSNNM